MNEWMNEYSLSPPLPGPSMNLSTEHPQGPKRRTGLKTFCFQPRSISLWQLAAFSWLSLEFPGFLYVAIPPSPQGTHSPVRGKRSKGFPPLGGTGPRLIPQQQNHRLSIPCFASCLLWSTPGRHASQAGNCASPTHHSSSRKQPTGLHWKSPLDPRVHTSPTPCLCFPLLSSKRWRVPTKALGSSQNPWGYTAWIPTPADRGPESADSGGSGYCLLLQLQQITSLRWAWSLIGKRGWWSDHTCTSRLPGWSYKPTRDMEKRPCSGLATIQGAEEIEMKEAGPCPQRD